MSVFNRVIKKKKQRGEVVTSGKAREHILGKDADADLELLLDECKREFKTIDEEQLIKAYHWCIHAHRNTMRKTGDPYYTHPLAVARILINEIPFDFISVVAALLHDVLDENDIYTIKDIRSEFGSIIADIIDGIVKIEHVESQKQAQHIQIENYHKLLLSLFKDVRIIVVKLADRLHNMRTLEPLTVERQQQISRETMDIYCPFAHRIGLANIKWELEDLSFKYLNRSEYDKIKDALQLTRKEREDYIKKFTKPIKNLLQKNELLNKNNVSFEISGRAKHIYSIYHKMVSRQLALDDINDLFAVRIILDTEDVNLCFYIYGVICELFPPVPGTFKNYIYMPKKNGYQSIHTAVVGPDKKNVEVQIRTRKMHELSEYGLAAHFRYKSDVIPTISVIEDENIQKWMDSLREIFDNIEEESPHKLIESISRNLLLDDIYVFTPARELKKLPKESTPLDFAFNIHSEIGYHCIGAKVNGRIVSLDYKLRNGDQVEILTSEGQTPTAEWYNIVITSRAKSAILKYLKDVEKKLETDGRKKWNDKVKSYNLSITNEQLDELLKSMKFESASKFFKTIATGEIQLDKAFEFIAYKFRESVHSEKDSSSKSKNKIKTDEHIDSKVNIFNNGVTERISSDLITEKNNKIEDYISVPKVADTIYTGQSNSVIQNKTDVKLTVSAAKCCYPLPDDKILGVISTGKEIQLHHRQCRIIQEMLNSKQSNLIELSWNTITLNEYNTEIIVTADNRENILNDITLSIITTEGFNIRGVSFDKKEDSFKAKFTLKIDKPYEWNKVLENIKKVNGIRSVNRKINN
jgi:RelA/SpoT family (p)ppGpp synthetase